MKWSIQQLRKIQTFPYCFSTILDFKELAAQVSDIIDIHDVTVNGEIIRIDDETYRFKYHIHAPLVLECAKTLDPVDYLFEKDYDEVYSLQENDEYFLIEKNTIDLYVMVWSNILIEKPINVTLENADEILRERGIILDDTELLDDDEEILFYSDGLEEDED